MINDFFSGQGVKIKVICLFVGAKPESMNVYKMFKEDLLCR